MTLRGELSNYATFGLFDSTNSFAGVDIRDLNHLETIIRDFRPDAVVNAIGITKQRTCESNIIPTIEIKRAVSPSRRDMPQIQKHTWCI